MGKLQYIFDNSKVGIAICNALINRFEMVNPAFAAIHGYDAHELNGISPDEVFVPEYLQKLMAESTHLCAKNDLYFETTHLRKDGSFVDVSVHVTLIKDGLGTVQQRIINIIDITDRKRTEQKLQEMIEFNQEIMNTIPDLLFELDKEGNYLNIWAQDETLLAAQKNNLLGKNVRDLLTSDAAEITLQTVREVDEKGQSLGNTIFIDLPNGRKWFELSASKRKSSGTYILLSRDITNRKLQEENLSKTKIKLAAVITTIPDLIWVKDANGVYVMCNPAFERFFGASSADIIGKTDYDFVSYEQADFFRQKDLEAMEAGETLINEEEITLADSGQHVFLETRKIPVYNGNEFMGVLGIGRDITERKMSEKKIEHMAHHDSLTGLPNRVLIKDRAEQIMVHAKRLNAKAAFLFIDLDGFKSINDTLGHSVGDSMLKSVASRLKACIRESDTISRQGGDEFLLILSGIQKANVISTIAEKILAELEKSFEIDSHSLSLSGSIGIALYPDHGETFETLLQSADTAMYKAKELGKNSYHFYTQQMTHHMIGEFKIQNDLKSALLQDEFILFYQPQIDLTTNSIIGVEALIRWRHPMMGMMPPMNFISIAENNGLIVPIGQWVIEEACRQAALWQEMGIDISVAVNISAMQFKRGNLEEIVKNALFISKIDPKWLELELTESIIMHDADNTLQSVRNLKALGIQLSIDDFGTGYSSLSYLKRFAVDKLKIDQSFVRDILEDKEDTAIVKTIIQMAKNLNLKTIAEGVETQEVLSIIQDFGCDEVQGYHFAKPMPANDFEHYFSSYSVNKTVNLAI
jgi:diguanylate cyclase (GGDEF)-like protein/PAS domain S-box-containing protein